MQTRRHFLQQMELLAGGLVCTALPALSTGCAARIRYATPTLVGDRLAIRVSDSGAVIIGWADWRVGYEH